MRLISLFILSMLFQFTFGQCDELDLSYNSNGILAINVGNQSGTDDNVIATFNTDNHIIVVGNIIINSIKQGGAAYFDHEGKFLRKLKIGTSHFVSHDYTVQAACLQHDGKLLVTGHVDTFFGKGPVFVARVNVDGTMDNTFGFEGIVTQNISGLAFNFMTNIIQDPDGSIVAIGQGRDHDGDLEAIRLTVNDLETESNSSVFSFSSFSSFGSYEFINGSVFKIENTFDKSTISFLSGEPFSMGPDNMITIDISEVSSKLTGISILSNNRLAAYGYVTEDEVQSPIVYVFDQSGNLDRNFNGTGYKIIDQTDSKTADIVLYKGTYYITTVHNFLGASIFKLNLDGTAIHDAWSSPRQSVYPILRGASIFVQDSTFLISGEIRNDEQSDFGLIKYRPCDYKETVFEDYPLTTIGELKQVDTEGIPILEDDYSTIGVVSSINFSSNLRALISIMDEENEGIFITGDTRDFDYIPELGDEILVSGILQSHFESTAELIWRYYRVESKDNPIPSPVDISELNTYSEGVYVRLENVTLTNDLQWKGDGSTFTVRATDGLNVFDIKIFDTSYWADKPAPQGGFIVSGIGGQDDPSIPYLQNYEIYPQFETDIIETTKADDKPIPRLNIYPNPSSTKLYVGGVDNPVINYNVIDATGKPYNVTLNGNILDITTLESGIYLLILKDNNGSVLRTERFVKK